MPENPPLRDFEPFRTLPGRLFLLSSALLVVVLVLQQFWTLPDILVVFRRVDALAFIVASVWLAGLAVARNRRAFLWRVRRKLLLSYVFLGVVPVVLIGAFVFTGGVLLYLNVASYVFREGYSDVVENVRQVAETAAGEIGRNPAIAKAAIERKYTNLASRFPALSLAVVPAGGEDAEVTATGAWKHLAAPAALPIWVTNARGFTGTLVYGAASAPDDLHLLIRSVAPTPDGSRMVVADLPVDTEMVVQIHDRTGTRIDSVVADEECGKGLRQSGAAATPSRSGSLFRETVASMECTDWDTGRRGAAFIRLEAPVARLYNRLTAPESDQIRTTLAGGEGWNVFGTLLIVLGALLLIIQGSALVAGGVLVRSITYAVHELFEGTERVRQGDFAHRIKIESRDQLGDLADSFNRMSGSMEHLLHVQREKQRLDDELRIAREIQKSLLPVRPPEMLGLTVADLCEPAREVGGDYYDFFDLGPRLLGVLIADVSGKGTSAALYMAELKGLMLALSRAERSPRRLLIDLNRHLADHLDNRSFITMTYAVLDLEAGTMTHARAGHTPLIVVSGGKSDVITPDGMVLGLRLPGAGERFEELLVEHTQKIVAGDVIVLYTDGITESMDAAGELFGDAALARVLSSHHRLDATGLRERVLREVKAFVGDAEQHDDMTMIVIKMADEAA